MPPIPPLTLKLLWAVVALILLPIVLPDSVLVQMLMWPLDPSMMGGAESATPAPYAFMPWQLLTHMLINPGVGGILFVALTVYFFGRQLEETWGERRYGLFLLTVAGVGAVVQLLVLTIAVEVGITPYHPVAGASAVMYGTLFAVAYLNPHQRVMLIIPPIPMKMWVMCAVFTGMEMLFGVFGSGNGLAHLGFLGGILGAWLHIRYWRGLPPFRPRGPKPPAPRKSHLRSVN
jgi:membrane associated rhomboid family serine protease